MDMAAYALAALIVVVAVGFLLAVVRVPPGQEWTLERLGRFRRTLTAGWHILMPLIERIGARQDIRERPLPAISREVICADRVSIRFSATAFMQIVDAARASYEVNAVETAVSHLLEAELTTKLAASSLSELLTQRDACLREVSSRLDPAVEAWGVRITRLELLDVVPPADLLADIAAERHAVAEASLASTRARAELIALTQRAEQALRAARIEQDTQLARIEHERAQQVAGIDAGSAITRAHAEAQQVAARMAQATAETEQQAKATDAQQRIDAARAVAELERIEAERVSAQQAETQRREAAVLRAAAEHTLAEREASAARAALEARIADQARLEAEARAQHHANESARAAAEHEAAMERLAGERARVRAEQAATASAAELIAERARAAAALEADAQQAAATHARIVAEAEARLRAADRDSEALALLRERLGGADHALLGYLAAREHALALTALARSGTADVVVNVPASPPFTAGAASTTSGVSASAGEDSTR